MSDLKLQGSVSCIKSFAERYSLKEKSGWWADITITKDGFINIQSDYGDYCHCWTSFGPDMKKFLISCSKGYLYGKFGRELPRELVLPETIKLIRKDIIEARRIYENFTEASCREFWDITEELKKDHYNSVEEFYRAVGETELPRLYDHDLSSLPCKTIGNYHLTTFLTLIWPEFIATLKDEIAHG